MEKEHDTNETLVGGEMIDTEETPQPRSDSPARPARSQRTERTERPGRTERTAEREEEPEEETPAETETETDTSVEGYDDDEFEPKAEKEEPKAEDEGESIDRVSASLDEFDKQRSRQSAQPKNDDDGKESGPSVREEAGRIEAERLRRVVEQYGTDDPLVEYARGLEARLQAVQASAYGTEREAHKFRLFSEPLEKALPGIYGTRESRKTNEKQARIYKTASESSTILAEAVLNSPAVMNDPLLSKINPDHLANMVSDIVRQIAGGSNPADSAAAAERKRIAATLKARQSNAGVASRPSGMSYGGPPRTKDEAKQRALAKFRNSRARRARE